MWKVVVTDNRGTYYPIAFFANWVEATNFEKEQKAKWTTIHVEHCEIAILHGVIVDASNWRIK
jgi:hypothetical protein